VASWALGAILREARALGMERVLVVCLDDNPASARTIERNGGVLEEVRGAVRRYWIELPAAGEVTSRPWTSTVGGGGRSPEGDQG
jgi:RimJ/RimL family protein N-acetyltransferase